MKVMNRMGFSWLLSLFLFAVSGPLSAVAQLTKAEVATLKSEVAQKGWTFKVAESEATQRSLAELCGLVEPSDWRQKARFVELSSPLLALPTSYDCRTQGGGLPPIRNQGGCGSCWAFATVGTLECAIQMSGGGTQDLSEQWLVSCNQSGWGCGGGWLAHDYHVLNGGLRDRHNQNGAPYEADFPYQQADASCAGPYPHRFWIKEWGFIGSQSGVPTVDEIKQAILTYGPVACAVYANDAFVAYSGGIYNNNDSRTINHAVVLVGWDDNNGQGYWIMRNSWGTTWGESGYMRIRYGCGQIGYGACFASYDKGGTWQVTPSEDFASSGPTGGPFSPSCKTYTLRNDGNAAYSWSAQSSVNWLTITPSSGSVPALSTREVSVCVNASGNALSGYHEATVIITNQTAGGLASRRVSISAGVTDSYTESFETTGNDSDYAQYLLVPSGGGYSVCRRTITALPTSVSGAPVLNLSDDDAVSQSFSGGQTFPFAGSNRSGLWINSNGNISFGQGDASYSETIAGHFAIPRISALFDDLDPSSGGQIYAQQLSDRYVVTWVNVPEYDQSNVNTFQVELYFDGRIQLSFLQLDAPDGILGLSAGLGTPAGFVASDFRSYDLCAGGSADLALTGLLVSPSTVTSKSFTYCSFTVANQGPASLDAESIVVDYYLSANATQGDQDDVKIGDTGFPLSLASGATYPLQLTETGLNNMVRLWTADLACGSYYVFAVVRVSDGFPADENSANNSDRTDAAILLSGSACLDNNDTCAGGLPLANGVYTVGDNSSAAQDSTPGRGIIYKGLWFTYTPSASGTVVVDTCPSDFDTTLEVMSGACGSVVTVGHNDDDPSAVCGLASRVTFQGVAGVTYRICAGGYGGDYGTLSIRATSGGGGAAPTITTDCPLPSGQVGSSYSRTLAASGGTAPYTWSLASGSVPGLNLDPNTGVLQGVPSTAGSFSVTVRVTGDDGAYSDKACSVAIASSAPAGQTFASVQNAVGYANNDWSFMTAWNLNTGEFLISSDWYTGNKSFYYNLAAPFQWVALFIYDDGTVQTRELRWNYRQPHVQ